MKIDKAKLRKTIKEMEEEYKHKTGVNPILFEEPIKKDFIKAVCLHGDHSTNVLKYMQNRNHPVTKRQICTYLRQIFGTHKLMGRPSLYVLDGNDRDRKTALYK